MFRSLVLGLAALGVAAPPAAADVPDVAPEVIARVAGACRPGDGFGHALGQAHEGARMTGMDEAFRPFRTMTVRTSPRSHRVIGVDIDAWHDEEAGTPDERQAAAARIVEAIDTEVARQGRFAERAYDEEEDVIRWTAPAADGAGETRFDISRLGVGVYLTCQDVAMEALALDEAFGRARVEKPVRPAMALPPRIDPADCADPAKAAGLLTLFEEQGGGGLMDGVRRNQEYFEHLADWYGQQLEDKGVWDQQAKTDFMMKLLEDPVLARGFEEQMERLEPMMAAVMSYMELREGGDRPGACRAMLRTADLLRDISAASEPQWSRVTELYQAEARRLGVTLED